MIFSPRLIFALLAAGTLTSCAPKEKVVKIAVAVPLTGDMGTEGQGLRRAIEMAVEEVNAAKRFPYKIEAVPFDDRADPKEAVTVANLIVSDPRIVAVIGPYNSGCAIPAAKVYARAPLAMISPAATNPEVTAQQLSPDWSEPKVVFRVVPTDDVQGQAAAQFALTKLHKRRMALLHDKTPYGQGLAEQFRRIYESNGGRVLSADGISVGDKDFKALLTKIKNDPSMPQGIYFGGLYTEAGLLLKQMRELGLNDPFVFISGDGSKTPALFDVAGLAAEGAYLSMVGIPVEELPGAREFIARYKKRWTAASDELKPFDHFGYEAAQIVFQALEKMGPLPDSGLMSRPALIERLASTRYRGLLGETVFDAKGDTLNKIITLTLAHPRTRTFESIR